MSTIVPIVVVLFAFAYWFFDHEQVEGTKKFSLYVWGFALIGTFVSIGFLLYINTLPPYPSLIGNTVRTGIPGEVRILANSDEEVLVRKEQHVLLLQLKDLNTIDTVLTLPDSGVYKAAMLDWQDQRIEITFESANGANSLAYSAALNQPGTEQEFEEKPVLIAQLQQTDSLVMLPQVEDTILHFAKGISEQQYIATTSGKLFNTTFTDTLKERFILHPGNLSYGSYAKGYLQDGEISYFRYPTVPTAMDGDNPKVKAIHYRRTAQGELAPEVFFKLNEVSEVFGNESVIAYESFSIQIKSRLLPHWINEIQLLDKNGKEKQTALFENFAHLSPIRAGNEIVLIAKNLGRQVRYNATTLERTDGSGTFFDLTSHLHSTGYYWWFVPAICLMLAAGPLLLLARVVSPRKSPLYQPNFWKQAGLIYLSLVITVTFKLVNILFGI